MECQFRSFSKSSNIFASSAISNENGIPNRTRTENIVIFRPVHKRVSERPSRLVSRREWEDNNVILMFNIHSPHLTNVSETHRTSIVHSIARFTFILADLIEFRSRSRMREISRINAERAKSSRRIRSPPPYNKRGPHNSPADIANRLYNEVRGTV